MAITGDGSVKPNKKQIPYPKMVQQPKKNNHPKLGVILVLRLSLRLTTRMHERVVEEKRRAAVLSWNTIHWKAITVSSEMIRHQGTGRVRCETCTYLSLLLTVVQGMVGEENEQMGTRHSLGPRTSSQLEVSSVTDSR